MAEHSTDELSHELALAQRRIEQLEAALMRRTELLENKSAELANMKASRVYKAAHAVQKLFNRFFPIHTRRRAFARSTLKSIFGLAGWALAARQARNGPPPEERYLSESTPASEYRRWIQRWEPKPRDLAAQREHRFSRPVKLSIVVPVYNPPLPFLEAMIQSVLDQTYGHWELCLADASTQAEVAPILARYAAADARVRVQTLTENRGIAGNSNAALDMATGDFIALLDHDDTLAPFALYEVVSAINQHPEVSFFYSDEDKLDTIGERVEPNFKPDWSPETLRSRNYICHLTVLRRSLVESIGGFRAGFDGAQDYDLVLRASEQVPHIVHIPQVLYHWRMHAQSTAANKGSKNYAYDNGKKALTEHFARLGVDASVHDGPILGTYQPIYHLRKQPLVSVIIPNKDHPEMLRRCVDSLAKSSYAHYELIVVENGSQQPETHAYYREIQKQPHIRVIEWTQPFNYAAVNNFAARQAQGELVLFLNNDIESINPDWLEALVKLAIQPGVGAVGAKLYYADDTIQHAGIVVGMGGVAGHAHLNFPRTAPGHMQRLVYTQNVAAVTGACLLMPKSVFDAVGGFDEGFVLAFNDVDLCLAVLAKGYRVVWTPDAELYHLESKTRGPEDTEEKQKRFKREYDLFHLKWGQFLKAGDPYYSPHFRLDRPDFALKAA
ncbi:MAG: glycosyltransferase family 2 protein [Bacteroidales bacterium]|nr:glycosyltransferase family 2 protein [Bacteroidales bacterium]